MDEKAGPNPVANSPLPWTGEFKDGLGNRITMMAYANPTDVSNERERADGYGIARFRKSEGTVTFECWPRFSDASQGDKAQFPGWPITVAMADNDGRKPVAWLPELIIEGASNAVVQVIEEATGELIYTVRTNSNRYQPAVYALGMYTVKVGRDKPDGKSMKGLIASEETATATKLKVTL
jgi:hypothetical protein